MTSMRRNGFTLIELLVALFIAALMFAMGYGAINQALQSRGLIQRHQQSLVELETAMSVMEQDFVQLAPRPVRDPLGENELPCLQGTSANSDTSATAEATDTSETSDTSDASGLSDTTAPLVTLTRSGWSNPMGVPRPELERVAYVFENGTLVREHWNVLDGTLSDTPVKRNLLKHVTSVTFRYLQPNNHSWVNTWPPINRSNPDPRERPMAVQVILDTKQWGRISRIFEVAQ